MAKRHFEAFAREIAASNQPAEVRAAMAYLVIRVAGEFNLRFDRERFLRAAGLPELAS